VSRLRGTHTAGSREEKTMANIQKKTRGVVSFRCRDRAGPALVLGILISAYHEAKPATGDAPTEKNRYVFSKRALTRGKGASQETERTKK